MIRVDVHGGGAAAEHRDNVLQVWNESFGAVADTAEWRETVWDRHRARADYRLATAYDGNRLVGFSSGYTGQPGQFRSDFVLDKLGQAVAEWVGGHFEFVELAVLPTADGKGLAAGCTTNCSQVYRTNEHCWAPRTLRPIRPSACT